MEEKIRCLLVKPNQLPIEIEINNTLEEKQRIVNGYIEVCRLLEDEEVVLICNEEGKINGMPLNRSIGYDIIAGPFLIVGDDYENASFKSLNDEQIKYYKDKFGKESILKENTISVEIDKIDKARKNRRRGKMRYEKTI